MQAPLPTTPSRQKVPTLRRTWTTTLVTFLAVIVVIVAATLLANQRERERYGTVMSELADETAALVVLDQAILESSAPMAELLYRMEGAGDAAQRAAAYEAARERLAQAFADTRTTLHTPDQRELLDAVSSTWAVLDAAVLASTELSEGDLQRTLRAGEDPFAASVWDVYSDMDRRLAEVKTSTVETSQSTVRQAEREGRAVGIALAAAVLGALGVALRAGRRMSSTVVAPLRTLTGAASTLHDADEHEPIAVPGAVRELQDLAASMNASASSVRRSSELLKSQAYVDALTSLPNRKAFGEALDHALSAPEREAVAVLFVDLDDFKYVNDSQGHAAGDALLRLVALRLRSAVRDTDLVARLGGDEFAVITSGDEDGDIAVGVAERILDAIRRPMSIDGAPVSVGCSIGIATSETTASSAGAEALLANADFAMYMAKGQGKCRYELHSEAMHTKMLTHSELRRGLPGALERREFELHYQPIFDLPSDRLLGYEALIRWQHPTHGLLAPQEFLTIAEETGAIIEIGSWVLDEACRTLAVLHRGDRTLFMTVNVAPQQLAAREFARTALSTTVLHGVASDRVILEVTEETAVASATQQAETLSDLRAHGFRIALDDFGSGFSSLRYLGDIPADIIKIDRSFMTFQKASMLDSIVGLARALDMQVIAEGIEHEAELQRLHSYGAIAGQGYYFAKPMAAGELTSYQESLGRAAEPSLG